MKVRKIAHGKELKNGSIGPRPEPGHRGRSVGWQKEKKNLEGQGVWQGAVGGGKGTESIAREGTWQYNWL